MKDKTADKIAIPFMLAIVLGIAFSWAKVCGEPGEPLVECGAGRFQWECE